MCGWTSTGVLGSYWDRSEDVDHTTATAYGHYARLEPSQPGDVTIALLQSPTIDRTDLTMLVAAASENSLCLL